MRKLILILSLVLGLSLTATADEASHKELVEQLFTVTNMQEGFDNTCREVIDMQLRSNPMMESFKDVITDFFTKYMSWESLKPEITKLYMETFTEDELRDIVSFLSSPVGIMYTEKSFDLTLKCMELGQKRVTDNMGELEAMLAEQANKLIEAEKAKVATTAETESESSEEAPQATPSPKDK